MNQPGRDWSADYEKASRVARRLGDLFSRQLLDAARSIAESVSDEHGPGNHNKK